MSVHTFGSFPNGGFSEFSDTSQNAFSPWIVTRASDIASGKFQARMRANSSTPVILNDPSKVRVHALGNQTITNTYLQRGTTFYRAQSYRWISSPILNMYAGDEIHSSGSGPLANGPVPLGGHWVESNRRQWVIRGGGNPNVQGSYKEVRFGINVPWVGLSNTITLNQWFHTLLIYDQWSDSATSGHFEMWAAPHGSSMVKVVPRTQMATCYPAPIGHYPMLSVYFERSNGGEHAFDVTAGAYSTSLSEIQAFQVANVGYDLWGTGPPPAPPPPSLVFTGSWTNAAFVDTVTGTRSPSNFGAWTTGVLVHPYNPAPSSASQGSWTLARVVNSAPFPPAAPVATVSPALTGSTVNGQTLTCSTGTWSNNPTSFSYLWVDSTTFAELQNGPTNTYVEVTGDIGRRIKVLVSATNAAGTSSTNSNTVGPVTAVTPPPDTTAPTNPSGLIATVNGTTITLTWTASTDASGFVEYQVERCQGVSCSGFTLLKTVGSNSTADSLLTASTSYSYRVRAADAVPNFSGYSNTATGVIAAVPDPSDTAPPSAPTGLIATAVSDTSIIISWLDSTDNVGVTSYEIERCTGDACTNFVFVANSGLGTSALEGGLAPSTSYSFRVRARDAASNFSQYSNVATAVTQDVFVPPPIPPAPLVGTLTLTPYPVHSF